MLGLASLKNPTAQLMTLSKNTLVVSPVLGVKFQRAMVVYISQCFHALVPPAQEAAESGGRLWTSNITAAGTSPGVSKAIASTSIGTSG